jgi:hypothetical protein
VRGEFLRLVVLLAKQKKTRKRQFEEIIPVFSSVGCKFD